MAAFVLRAVGARARGACGVLGLPRTAPPPRLLQPLLPPPLQQQQQLAAPARAETFASRVRAQLPAAAAAPARALSSSPPTSAAPDLRVPGATFARLGAAGLRTLSVRGVADAIEQLAGADAARLLLDERIDGAALLEMTVDELRSFGMRSGDAHAIVRAVGSCAAEAQVAAAEARKTTLTVFPPRKRRSDANNSFKISLTPESFLEVFSPSRAPLRLVNSSGSALRVVTSLAEAVEGCRAGMVLQASRSYDDDLTALNGFVTNCATAFEQKSTLALSQDAALLRKYGPLELVNNGEVVELALSRGSGGQQLRLAPDGLVAALQASAVLFNSAKLSPSEAHVDQVREDAAKLGEMLLADWASVRTEPPAAKAQLRGRLRVVPFLSGDGFSAAVAAKCRAEGVGIVRPSGEGFVVEPAAAGAG
jgi:hypothetical protein